MIEIFMMGCLLKEKKKEKRAIERTRGSQNEAKTS
jgi:hypothetical protein